MGFEIRGIKTRDGKDTVNIRGTSEGYVEFFRISTGKDKDTGEEIEVSVPYWFYASIEMALNKIFRMRVCNRDASTLEELLTNVKEERLALQREFEGILPTTRRIR